MKLWAPMRMMVMFKAGSVGEDAIVGAGGDDERGEGVDGQVGGVEDGGFGRVRWEKDQMHFF